MPEGAASQLEWPRLILHRPLVTSSAHVLITTYTGTLPGRARRLHSQIARHFRLPHLLLLSFESRNASLPFRRVRAENLSFDVVEASDFDRTATLE